jgi:hypothetical protein
MVQMHLTVKNCQEDRADAVKVYLEAKVSGGGLSTKVLENQLPIATKLKAGKANNRRTEVKLVKYLKYFKKTPDLIGAFFIL